MDGPTTGYAPWGLDLGHGGRISSSSSAKEEGEGDEGRGRGREVLYLPPRAAPPWIPAGAGAAAMDLAPAVVDLAPVTVVVVDAPAAAATRREGEGRRHGSAPCRSAPWRGREEGRRRGEARSVGDAVVDAAATLLWRSLPPATARTTGYARLAAPSPASWGGEGDGGWPEERGGAPRRCEGEGHE